MQLVRWQSTQAPDDMCAWRESGEEERCCGGDPEDEEECWYEIVPTAFSLDGIGAFLSNGPVDIVEALIPESRGCDTCFV